MTDETEKPKAHRALAAVQALIDERNRDQDEIKRLRGKLGDMRIEHGKEVAALKREIAFANDRIRVIEAMRT